MTDRIDQAAAVVQSAMHNGDGGRQARELLAFDASTMGKADYQALVEQVQTTEALSLNELMRQGRHDEALVRLREDANVFTGNNEFVSLAGEVRALNKATRTPSHLEFFPVYQTGDAYGRPTAVEIDLTTVAQTPTGNAFQRRDTITRVDNRPPTEECHPTLPQEVSVIPIPTPVIADNRNQGGFSFNLEIEIGRERMRRHDPRWCPDRDWHPHNAPPGFNLEIEIGRVRDDYRRRGDHNWNPARPTSQTVINQINQTTIINQNTTNVNKVDSHNKTTIDESTRTGIEDKSRTTPERRPERRTENSAPQNRVPEVTPITVPARNRRSADSHGRSEVTPTLRPEIARRPESLPNPSREASEATPVEKPNQPDKASEAKRPSSNPSRGDTQNVTPIQRPDARSKTPDAPPSETPDRRGRVLTRQPQRNEPRPHHEVQRQQQRRITQDERVKK